jgi:hypothetical protein
VADPEAGDSLRDAKSSILLKEWETLRTEILARMQSQFQLLTFTVVAATFIYSQQRLGNFWRLAGIVIVLMVVWIAWAGFRRAINRCAERIREIEVAVNTLFDDNLLQWEYRVQREREQPAASWWPRLPR